MRRTELMLGGKNINDMNISQAMEDRVRFCHPDTPWKDIATALVEGGYGSLPVVDNEKNLKGIVSEYDLLKVLEEEKDVNKTKAEDIMTKNTVTVNEDTPISELIKILEDKHLIRVPVVKGSTLVGIIARRDVLLCFLKATAEPPHWV